MSMRPKPIGPVPEDTARIARAAFPKGNPYMLMRDVLGTIYDDADRWSETRTARGRSMIHIDFSPNDCSACPSRSSCTRAKDLPRTLTLQPQEEHEAIQFARKRQKTEEFASLYCRRAGIEGTVSQGVRAFGLRQARYRGLKETDLQELATAASINAGRLTNWLNDSPIAATRRSGLAALAPAS